MSDKLQFVVTPRQAKAYRTSNWPSTAGGHASKEPPCQIAEPRAVASGCYKQCSR